MCVCYDDSHTLAVWRWSERLRYTQRHGRRVEERVSHEWSRMPGDGAAEWRTARVTGVVSAQLRLLLNWLCLTGSDRLVMLTAIADKSVPQTSPWRTVRLHVGTCLSQDSTFNVGFEKSAATDFSCRHKCKKIIAPGYNNKCYFSEL